jgi:hypothetical protein
MIMTPKIAKKVPGAAFLSVKFDPATFTSKSAPLTWACEGGFPLKPGQFY